MMLKSKLATFIGTLILAGSAFANICPDINDIKAEGLTMAELIAPNIYLTYNISTFNTSSNWGFVMAPFESETDGDAIDAANEILNTMSAPGVVDEHSGAMLCTYDTGDSNVLAAAIKDDGQMSAMKLRQYIQKNH